MPGNGDLRVLVVEDDHLDREAVRRFLKEGYVISEATDAVEAEEVFAKDRFDCVLLDYRIPNGGELELLPRFVDCGVPVIILTGLGNEATAVNAMKMGASDYLVKGSFDGGRLRRCLEQACRQAALEEALRNRQRTVERQRDLLEREVAERRLIEEQLRASNEQLQCAMAELKKAREEALKQERIATLGRIASGIAHDLNNALLPAVSLSDYVLKCTNSETECADEIQAIHRSVMAAAAVVKRLRSFYAQSSAEETVFDLSIAMEQALELTSHLRPADTTNLRVVRELGSDILVRGVLTEIRDVLVNLIINSVHAMKDGGTLTVRTDSSQGKAWFEVEDEGPGMPEDVLARCTEAYFSTKGDGGTGLGLFLAQTTISRFDGLLEFTSGSGGTVVRATFSSASPDKKNRSKTRARKKSNRPAITPRTILAVEDDTVLAGALVRILQNDGHTVSYFESPVEAIEHLESGFRPDLIITDRSMPRISGDEFARIVKDRFQIPVLMATGYGDIMEAAGDKPDGVDAILPKPFTLGGLRDVLSDFPWRKVSDEEMLSRQ